MVVAETLEGVINATLWFHYAVEDDVLYLRLASERGTPTLGEETADGFLLLRREDNDLPVGVTILNWWKRLARARSPIRWRSSAA